MWMWCWCPRNINISLGIITIIPKSDLYFGFNQKGDIYIYQGGWRVKKQWRKKKTVHFSLCHWVVSYSYPVSTINEGKIVPRTNVAGGTDLPSIPLMPRGMRSRESFRSGSYWESDLLTLGKTSFLHQPQEQVNWEPKACTELQTQRKNRSPQTAYGLDGEEIFTGWKWRRNLHSSERSTLAWGVHRWDSWGGRAFYSFYLGGWERPREKVDPG